MTFTMTEYEEILRDTIDRLGRDGGLPWTVDDMVDFLKETIDQRLPRHECILVYCDYEHTDDSED